MPMNAVAMPFSFAVCKAHVFDETFGFNGAFTAEVFVAAPQAVAMEFDLFGREAEQSLG